MLSGEYAGQYKQHGGVLAAGPDLSAAQEAETSLGSIDPISEGKKRELSLSGGVLA